MAKKVTYLLGAGASANAIPVVGSFKERFKLFCEHLKHYWAGKIEADQYKKIHNGTNLLIQNIEGHYTVDTYAKKLFLQNPELKTNDEYVLLTKYLSSYFIYEQLRKDQKQKTNHFIYNTIHSLSEIPHERRQLFKNLVIDFDYRYDAFFAAILNINDNTELSLPENIKFVSWNYDLQAEMAFSNFSKKSLISTFQKFQTVGADLTEYELENVNSSFIKLNGTAFFLNKDTSLPFDLIGNSLDEKIFSTIKDIILDDENSYQNLIRFSWEKTKISKNAIENAQKVIGDSDIIVIIGYSFPYFNRDTDREIFKYVSNDKPIYIQVHKDNIDSVKNRFKGIRYPARVIEYTELDQFLIPNEM